MREQMSQEVAVGKSKKNSVNRRDFLRTAAAGTAALVAVPGTAKAAAAEPRGGGGAPPLLKAPAADGRPSVDVLTVDHPGSDFMVDAFQRPSASRIIFARILEILSEACMNRSSIMERIRTLNSLPAATKKPQLPWAHGYFKIEGKPLLVGLHGTLGVQHASMAIYNAFCDRVPVVVVLGNFLDAANHRGSISWPGRTPHRIRRRSFAISLSGMISQGSHCRPLPNR